MLPQINHPVASIYRRAVCKIAIAFTCRLYPIEVYTHKELAELPQECLDLIENTKPQCGPVYYARYFDRLYRFATILHRCYANKASRQTLAEERKMADEDMLEMDVVDELEEISESLRNHTI
jgi:heme oxygenase